MLARRSISKRTVGFSPGQQVESVSTCARSHAQPCRVWGRCELSVSGCRRLQVLCQSARSAALVRSRAGTAVGWWAGMVAAVHRIKSHGVVTRVQRATTVKGICECVCSGEPTARGPVGASAAKRPDEGSRVGRMGISVNEGRGRLTDGTCSRRHCAAGVLGWPAPSVSRACGQVFGGNNWPGPGTVSAVG